MNWICGYNRLFVTVFIITDSILDLLNEDTSGEEDVCIEISSSKPLEAEVVSIPLETVVKGSNELDCGWSSMWDGILFTRRSTKFSFIESIQASLFCSGLEIGTIACSSSWSSSSSCFCSSIILSLPDAVSWKFTIYRRSHRRCSVKKVVLQNLAKFTQKCLSFNRPATLLKNCNTGVFQWILLNF